MKETPCNNVLMKTGSRERKENLTVKEQEEQKCKIIVLTDRITLLQTYNSRAVN